MLVRRNVVSRACRLMSTILGPGHLLALTVIAILITAQTLVVRRLPGRWLPVFLGVLGGVLLVAEATWWVGLLLRGMWTPADGLPLQLCDAGALVVVAALWWRRPLLVELSWFWGLAGSVQGLLTPDLPQHFPAWWFLQYYVVHGAIVGSAILLVIALRVPPRPGSVRRIFLLTLAYTAVVGAIDVATGGDYMYLRRPPPVHTLLDVMGPWPWYLVSGAALALALFWLLDAPFRAGRALSR
jgi:hypothetical integral membrane protein (TIGR02206 family)